ncbi:hypothetical protein TUE45_00160 [Streptomyces reticuli]|nr:hypothetical protein TUE45_00160 [Streptomyces reticuli]
MSAGLGAGCRENRDRRSSAIRPRYGAPTVTSSFPSAVRTS